eukprot:15249080-Alexandrium_andersonii.AAC.1
MRELATAFLKAKQMWTYAGDATVLGGGSNSNVAPMEIDAMRKGKQGKKGGEGDGDGGKNNDNKGGKGGRFAG